MGDSRSFYGLLSNKNTKAVPQAETVSKLILKMGVNGREHF